jgi:hypothetical protein
LISQFGRKLACGSATSGDVRLPHAVDESAARSAIDANLRKRAMHRG